MNPRDSNIYEYDGLSRRVAKLVSGSVTRSVYDGWQQVAEHRDGGWTDYAFGSYIDELLAMVRDGMTHYYITGSNYNVEAIADAAGNVVERYEVDPYGAFVVWTPGTDLTFGTADDVAGAASTVVLAPALCQRNFPAQVSHSDSRIG
jgi:hypothetical protein